jgi:hypothetical protein
VKRSFLAVALVVICLPASADPAIHYAPTENLERIDVALHGLNLPFSGSTSTASITKICHRHQIRSQSAPVLGEQNLERREKLSQANKLSRTYATLLEALNRHRGKGQQKVTVEHVHVHSGGQAVVGMVETPGEGTPSKSEEQPHAQQIAYALEPALPSPDEDRDALPARDDERALPDARRNVARCTEGQ